jgi:hypothetical protein
MTKGLFEARPIYHKLDETIRGHVACSFLALVMKKQMEDRLAAVAGVRKSWPDVIADLASLTETEAVQDGRRLLLRTAPRPAASLALSALGVAPPPTERQVAAEDMNCQLYKSANERSVDADELQVRAYPQVQPFHQRMRVPEIDEVAMHAPISAQGGSAARGARSRNVRLRHGRWSSSSSSHRVQRRK